MPSSLQLSSVSFFHPLLFWLNCTSHQTLNPTTRNQAPSIYLSINWNFIFIFGVGGECVAANEKRAKRSPWRKKIGRSGRQWPRTRKHTDRHGQTQFISTRTSLAADTKSRRLRRTGSASRLLRSHRETINQSIHWEKEASSIGNHPNNQHVISSAPAGEGGTP